MSPLSLIEERSLGLLDLVDSLNCGMVARGPEGTILFVNERIRQWLGYKQGELKGQPLEILLPDELQEVAHSERRAVEEGDLRAVITVLKRKDGTTFPVLIVPNRVTSQSGGFEGYVAVVADLGAVQTAKQAGYRAGDDLGAAIDRIARELQLLGISASALRLDPSPPITRISSSSRLASEKSCSTSGPGTAFPVSRRDCSSADTPFATISRRSTGSSAWSPSTSWSSG